MSDSDCAKTDSVEESVSLGELPYSLSGPPYIRLFEKQEQEAQRFLKIFKTREGKPLHPWRKVGPRLWQLKRFFVEIEGFIKGDLDLAGRPPHRWDAYIAKLTRYLDDFHQLLPTIRLSTVTVKREFFDEFEDTVYDMTDELLWRRMRKRWQIPKAIEFGIIYEHSVGASEAMKKFNGQVKLQKRYLMDLPAELLYNIFASCSVVDARILSMTCKYLNSVGQGYIYGVRTLVFQDPLCRDSLELDYDLPVAPQLMIVANDLKSKFLSYASFLVSRPDLCSKIKGMHFANEWNTISLQCIQGHITDTEIAQLEETFFIPVCRAFDKVLCISPHLTYLSLSRYTFTLDSIRDICSLENLYVFSLAACYIPSSVRKALRDDNQRSAESRVPNVRISMGGVGHSEPWSSWYSLAFCPHVLNLSVVSGIRSGGMPFALAHIWHRFAFIRTLRALNISNLSVDGISDLGSWFARAALQNIALRLTHFKISSALSIPQDASSSLLQSLSGAPLEALVLEGLAYSSGQPDLIREISDAFPDLQGLTLTLRENQRQRQTRPVVWPHPSWSYAPDLAHFTSLVHFGWNFRFKSLQYTPHELPRFEKCEVDGYPTYEELDSSWMAYREEEDAESLFDDEYLIVGPFAAYCQTLETFSSGIGHWCKAYNILRTPNETGGSGFKVSTTTNKQCSHDVDRWDPNSAWPITEEKNTNGK